MSDVQQFILNKLEKLDEKLDEVREHNTNFKTSFAHHLLRDEEIHKEVVKLGNSIDKHSNLLDEYNQQLEEHMRRTEILENKVLPLIQEKHEDDTVKRWWEGNWSKAAKVAGWLSAIGGLVVIIMEIVSKL
jgi:uncharacterized coiled-coil DUF342 family protein